jgi:RNA 2',3'-cyclic 3'-phosphodiesterase
MIRSFFAIEPPSQVRNEIARVSGLLRNTGADVKWVRPESVHLTLKFLGDVAEADIDPLARAVGDAAVLHRPMELEIRGLGVFPGLKKPRVVWLGLSGNIDGLKALQQGVEMAAAEFGFEPEKRPFKAHLTLGRIRSGRGQNRLMTALETIKPENQSFPAAEVVLFKSDLKPTGAVYTALHRLPLLA